MALTADSKDARRSALGRGFVLAAIALSAACAGGQPPSVTPAGTGSVATLVGDAACDSDAQCHTIGIGAKACGGPQRYLAWSSLRTDGAALRSAAEHETRAARAQAEAAGVMSNCSVTVDPGAYCAAPEPASGNSPSRRCQTRRSGAGGGAAIY
jgi:hypothetical protein